MTRLRLLRLQSDYEAVRRLAHLHPKVEVEGVTGNPPERYRLLLHVRSLREEGDAVKLARKHRLEITLPAGYPRMPPNFRMLTPVFHPNIAPHAVCIGDHWSASESLDLMIQRVGEMLAFQSYNIKSPLNGQAARWVQENLHRLPTDKEEFFADLRKESSLRETESTDRCSNCGAEGGRLAPCGQGHGLCAQCSTYCPICADLLCLSCGVTRCGRCHGVACANCEQEGARGGPCETAGHMSCTDCSSTCDTCHRLLCLACGEVLCPICGAGQGGEIGCEPESA
jgi:ubiquitin-protein ligase